MAGDVVAIQIPKPSYREGSAFTATAYFRTRSTGAAATPTNVYYRLDNLTTSTQLATWTSVSPAGNVSIAITATHNAIQDASNRTERVQLTVALDHGLSTQVHESRVWEVENLTGSP